MQLWTNPMITAVVGGKEKGYVLAAMNLRLRMEKEGATEAEILSALAELAKNYSWRNLGGSAKGLRRVNIHNQAAIRRQEAEDFRRDRTGIQEKIEDVIKKGEPGWEEEVERLQRLHQKRLEQHDDFLWHMKKKIGKQRGALAATHVAIVQSPHVTKSRVPNEKKKASSKIFGPWWVEPATEDLECKVWKAADLYYQTIPDSAKILLRDLCRPEKSTYDEWMGHAIWHLLRGIRPAMAPFRENLSRPSVVLSAKGKKTVSCLTPLGVSGNVAMAAVGFIAAAIISAALAVRYAIIWSAGGVPGMLHSRLDVYPQLDWDMERFIPMEKRLKAPMMWWQEGPDNVFDNGGLYEAYAALWNRKHPAVGFYGNTLVTSLFRSSHWRNAPCFGSKRSRTLYPTKSHSYLGYLRTGDSSPTWYYEEKLLSNRTNYTLLPYCYPTSKVCFEYFPGRIDELTKTMYFRQYTDEGVYDYDPEDPYIYVGNPYTLKWFDGIHAWVHWPWPPEATRYSRTKPPDWWQKESIEWYGHTWYRNRPPHKYMGNPILKPY